MYEVKYAEDVSKDLKELTAFKRKEILDKIDQELLNEPTRETRNKKVLADVEPPWPFKEPFSTMWTLMQASWFFERYGISLRIRLQRKFYESNEYQRLRFGRLHPSGTTPKDRYHP